MFDAAGNLWMLAAVQLFNDLSDDLNSALDTAVDEFNTVLVRAIYDPATFTFECEKIFDVGNVLPLGNAQRCATLEELLAQADVVTLHVPDTAQTRQQEGRADRRFPQGQERFVGGLAGLAAGQSERVCRRGPARLIARPA